MHLNTALDSEEYAVYNCQHAAMINDMLTFDPASTIATKAAEVNSVIAASASC